MEKKDKIRKNDKKNNYKNVKEDSRRKAFCIFAMEKIN